MNNANISITSNNSQAIRQTQELTNVFNTLNSTINNTEVNINQLGKSSESFWSKLGSFSQGLYATIGNLKEFANAAKKAFDYFREGADFAEAEMNFKAYVQTMGYSADELVSKFRKATRNQISDAELMKSATKALRVAGIEDVNAISKLYEIADTKGDLLGLSLQDTFDKIVDSITSGNSRALIQLGLLPESFSKATKSTDLLKNRTEILKTVIQQAGGDFKALANIGETSSDKFNQIEAAFSNVNREMKKGLTEAAMPIIEYVKNDGIPTIIALTKSFNENLIPLFKNFSEVLKDCIIDPITTALTLFGRWRSESEYIAENMSKFGYAGQIGELEYKKQKLQDDFKTVEKAIVDAVNHDINNSYDRARYSKHYVGVKSATDEEIQDFGLRYARQLEKEIKNIEEKQKKLINEHKEAIKKQQEELNKPIAFTIRGFAGNSLDTISKNLDTVKYKTQDLKSAFKQAFDSIKTPEKAAETAIDNLAKSVLAVNGPFGIMGNSAIEAFANIEAAAAKMNLHDTLSEIRKLSESEKDFYNLNQRMASGDTKNIVDMMLGIASHITKSSDVLNQTEPAIKEIGQNMYEEFTAETANAITDGLLSADFSGFRQNLGSVIRSVTGNYLTDTFASILKGSNQGVLQTASGGLFKQVYTGSGNSKSLNVGNLLTNVGIGLGVSWLTGEGGLFGKRKIKGAENIDKSKSLNEQIDAAKTLRDDLLTAVGISEVTRQALEEAMFSYTWTSSHKNHNPFHRTKTYNLHGEAEALASIANLETLQKLAASEQANRNYQLWELSRGDTVGSNLLSYQDTISAYEYIAKAKNYNSAQLLDVLNKQNAEKANISSIQTQIANLRNSQQTSSSRNGKTSISREINKLEAQLTNAQNALASLIAEYNTGNSNKYSDAQIAEAKLAAEQAKQALISAQQSERTAFTSNFLNNSTIAAMYGNNSGILSKLLGEDYSKFDTSSSIQQMLPMLEAAGLKDFNLQKAMLEAGNDTQKQLAVYNEQQGILEQALKTYEAIMKDNREEALNTRLSVEEQQAAFERWQEAFNQVLAIQEEIASNTNTIAELEKNKYADSFAAQLSDVMTVVAEAVRQTNGKETVIYYHNVTGKEIIAKLKAAIQNSNITNADDLLVAINETEQLEIWG